MQPQLRATPGGILANADSAVSETAGHFLRNTHLATSTAMRVLPLPPAPVSVQDVSASSASASGSQSAIPISRSMVDRGRQLGAGVVYAADPAVQLAETEVAVGLERAHPQILGQGQRLPGSARRPGRRSPAPGPAPPRRRAEGSRPGCRAPRRRPPARARDPRTAVPDRSRPASRCASPCMVTRRAGWKPQSIAADSANSGIGLGIPPGQGVGVAEIRLDHVLAQVELPLLADLQAPLQEDDRLGDLAAPQVDVSQTFEQSSLARAGGRSIPTGERPRHLCASAASKSPTSASARMR